MAKATIVAITVEGEGPELRDVVVDALDRLLERSRGTALTVNGALEAADAGETSSGMPLDEDVKQQWEGVSHLAQRALFMMASSPDGVTSRQLQEELEVDGRGLSGVLSSYGRGRKHWPNSPRLYTKSYTDKGLAYRMKAEIAEIVRHLAAEDLDE